MASSSDKFREATSGTRPEPANLTGTKTIGASSITLNTTTGWPTATGVDFIIYQTDISGAMIPGTQTDWIGVVSGTSINGLVLKAGTDQQYNAGSQSVVIAAATAAWGSAIADGILIHADQDGTLKAGAVDNAAVLASDVVTTAKILNANVTAPKIVGIDKSVLTTDSNPYKFSVYRNAAQSIAGGGTAKVGFDTEAFDTNNNFDSTTNNRYTAPIDGFYQISACITATVDGASVYGTLLYRNGSLHKNGTIIVTGTGTTSQSFPLNVLLQLTAGDYIEIYWVNGSGGAKSLVTGAIATYFMGFLMSRT